MSRQELDAELRRVHRDGDSPSKSEGDGHVAPEHARAGAPRAKRRARIRSKSGARSPNNREVCKLEPASGSPLAGDGSDSDSDLLRMTTEELVAELHRLEALDPRAKPKRDCKATSAAERTEQRRSPSAGAAASKEDERDILRTTFIPGRSYKPGCSYLPGQSPSRSRSPVAMAAPSRGRGLLASCLLTAPRSHSRSVCRRSRKRDTRRLRRSSASSSHSRMRTRGRQSAGFDSAPPDAGQSGGADSTDPDVEALRVVQMSAAVRLHRLIAGTSVAMSETELIRAAGLEVAARLASISNALATHGDWLCHTCSAHNAKNKMQCHRCLTARLQ